MKNKSILKKKDIISSYFNQELYMRILTVRKERGLPTSEDIYPEGGRIFNHQLEGKQILNLKNNKISFIQSVHKHWYHGWYIVLLVYSLSETESKMLCKEIIDGKMYGHSHGVIIYQNISCEDKIVLKSIKQFDKKYKFL